MDLLAFANGLDGTKRVYKIGVPLPGSEVPGLVVVQMSGRKDAVGFSCHNQMVIAQPKKQPETVRMFVILLSKQFVPPEEKEHTSFASHVLNATIEALQLVHVAVEDKDNITGLPSFLLEDMREVAIASAVQTMREQMHHQAMAQQAQQKIVTPGGGGLVVPGQPR